MIKGVFWMEPKSKEIHLLSRMKGPVFCYAFWDTCKRELQYVGVCFTAFSALNKCPVMASK